MPLDPAIVALVATWLGPAEQVCVTRTTPGQQRGVPETTW